MERADFPKTSLKISSSFRLEMVRQFCARFFAGNHVRELEAVTHQVTELPDFRRRDKVWLYHVAHEQVANPFGILAVRLVALLRLGIFGMGKDDMTSFFKDVEYGDPVLAGRFYADFRTVIFGKLVRRSLSRLEKEEKRASLYSVNPLGSVMPM